MPAPVISEMPYIIQHKSAYQEKLARTGNFFPGATEYYWLLTSYQICN